MTAIKLWELLFAMFVFPAFWFGWKWQFRRMGISMIGKTVVLTVETVMSGIKEAVGKLKKGDGSHDKM